MVPKLKTAIYYLPASNSAIGGSPLSSCGRGCEGSFTIPSSLYIDSLGIIVLFCFFDLLEKYIPKPATNATAATTPTTIPPIAPPDICEDVLDDGLEVDELVDVGELVAVGELVDIGGTVDVALTLDEVVELEDVCVAAINVAGSKVHELNDGLEELNDEYVSFSTDASISSRVSRAVFQQLLICFGVPVQTSLPTLKIRHYAVTLALLAQDMSIGDEQQTFYLDSTRHCHHRHSRS
jgi:hypothetical protein